MQTVLYRSWLVWLLAFSAAWAIAQPPPIRSHIRTREPVPVTTPPERVRPDRVRREMTPRLTNSQVMPVRNLLARVLLNGNPSAVTYIHVRPGNRTVRTDEEGITSLNASPGDTLTFFKNGLVAREAVIPPLKWSCFEFDMATSVLTPVPLVKASMVMRSMHIPNFPWPPPHASASEVLDGRFFSRARTLAGVDSALTDALKRSGYFERSYYRVPQGFALVTRIEQIDEQAAPKPDPDRWSLQVKSFDEFSIMNYLKSLFQASVGRFRIIAFIVTNQPVTENQSDETSFNEAMAWLKAGAKSLPENIGLLPYKSDYRCTALIYEFQKPENAEALLVDPSLNQGAIHLQKAKILPSLNR